MSASCQLAIKKKRKKKRKEKLNKYFRKPATDREILHPRRTISRCIDVLHCVKHAVHNRNWRGRSGGKREINIFLNFYSFIMILCT